MGITLRGAALPEGLVGLESFWHLGQPSCKVSPTLGHPHPPSSVPTHHNGDGKDTSMGQRCPEVPHLVPASSTTVLGEEGHAHRVSSADKCIQNVYRDLRLQRKSTKEYMGILCSLIMQEKLPLDDIKASVTEMMAGGVDTVRSRQGR